MIKKYYLKSMNINFYYCELCNEGIRFRSAKELVEFHYTSDHKSMLASRVNFLQNQEAKLLVIEHLQNIENKKLLQKQIEEQRPIEVIQRKCEICFEVVPEGYEEYVTHVLAKHNLNIAQKRIADTYIYTCIATGKITRRACEICREDTGNKVFDYIMHINLKHKMLINDSLKNYVKDPYVISIVLSKDLTYKNVCKNTTTCPECGEDLDLDNPYEMKIHKDNHTKFKEVSKSFHQSEKIYNPYYLNQTQPFQQQNQSQSQPYQQQQQSQIKSSPIIQNFHSQPKVDNNINNHINNILQNQKVPINSEELKGLGSNLGNIIIINQNINSNNTNSNVSTYTNSNVNSNINSNNNQSNEEIKKLTKQLEDLTLKINTLQDDQKKAEEEKQKITEFIQKKFGEKDFQMSQIQKDLENLNKLEASISEINSQIKELKSSDEELKEKISKQDKKIDDLEVKVNERIKELQTQYEFLNQQQGTLFSDKLNAVEKELMLLQAEVEKKNSKSEIDFSVPSYWSFQKDYLIVNSVDMLSNEYSKIESLFIDTFGLGDSSSNAFNKYKNKKAKIISIKRVQNTEIWKNYCFAKHQLLLKGNAEEKLLFHGSSATDPALIYEGKEEGFDLRFARGGFYGHAIYFHLNSGYSDDYAFKTKTGTKLQIVANVLIGNYIEVDNDSETSKFKHPPFIPGKKERYDSVKGKKHDKFMIYNNLRAYPHYIVEYKDV